MTTHHHNSTLWRYMSIICVWILVFMICLYWGWFRLTCGEKPALWKFIIDLEKRWCGKGKLQLQTYKVILGIWLLNFSGEKLIQFKWGTIHAIVRMTTFTPPALSSLSTSFTTVEQGILARETNPYSEFLDDMGELSCRTSTSLKLTVRTSFLMVGRLLSFWEGLFSERTVSFREGNRVIDISHQKNK